MSDNNEEKMVSHNQPLLDRFIGIIDEYLGKSAIIESYINVMDSHLPCVIIANEFWGEVAQICKNHPELQCDYLRNLSGVDQETHFEVVYHLLSMKHQVDYCVKIKANKDQPSIQSITSVWPTANWNEREVFDLLGIHFQDHPDLRRIMMPDDWVGFPLRKDYVPIDPEV
jgi:NADH-quinone oxidoreductase subunit C